MGDVGSTAHFYLADDLLPQALPGHRRNGLGEVLESQSDFGLFHDAVFALEEELKGIGVMIGKVGRNGRFALFDIGIGGKVPLPLGQHLLFVSPFFGKSARAVSLVQPSAYAGCGLAAPRHRERGIRPGQADAFRLLPPDLVVISARGPERAPELAAFPVGDGLHPASQRQFRLPGPLSRYGHHQDGPVTSFVGQPSARKVLRESRESGQ